MPQRKATKRKRTVIHLERAADGSWHVPGDIGGAFVSSKGLEQTSPYLPRSPAELATLQQITGLRNPPEGVDVKPSLLARLKVYEHPPVPGSIGHWRGKGTRNDPYRWVGVSEKLAAYAALALVLVWGAEVIETDVSNWWQSSALNLGNDLTKLGDYILTQLGIPHNTDSQGNVTAVGARSHADFWTWAVQQVMIQGSDLEAATQVVNQLSTGFTSGPGGPPPGGGGGGTTSGPPGLVPFSVALSPPTEVVQIGSNITFKATPMPTLPPAAGTVWKYLWSGLPPGVDDPGNSPTASGTLNTQGVYQVSCKVQESLGSSILYGSATVTITVLHLEQRL